MIDFFYKKINLFRLIHLFSITVLFFLISLYFSLNKEFFNFEEILNSKYYSFIDLFKINFIYIINTIIFLSVFLFIFNPTNIKEKIIFTIIILNPFIILGTNYFTYDLFVFYLIFFISQNSSGTKFPFKIYFLNWILISYFVFQNFIYISLAIATFIENNKRLLYQNVFLIFLFLMISLIIIVSNFNQLLNFDYPKYFNVLENENLIYSFSFINFLNLFYQNIGLNFYLTILISILLILFIYFLIKRSFKKKKLYKNVIGIFHLKERIFLLAGNLLIIKYFFSPDSDLNDIFLILLVPLIYKFYDKFNISLLLYFILSLVIKIIISYTYIFLYNSYFLILFKNLIILLDFINIIFAFTIVVSLNSLIIQNLNIKRKRFFEYQRKLQL